MKLSDLGEGGLLDLIRDWTPSHPPVLVGVGDDAAVLETGGDRDLVVSTDAYLDDVHFRTSDLAPDEIGHRAMAGALSDLAAMGAVGLAAFVGLHVPSDTAIEFVRDLYRGMRRVAEPSGVQIAGGDTVQGTLALDVTAVGTVPRGQAVLRSGARAGDELFVSGPVGRSEAGRRLLTGAVTAEVPEAARKEAEAAHRAPRPRFDVVELLRGLARPGAGIPASAMIDVSDGLALDLRRLCDASGVGSRIEESRIPVDEAARRIARSEGRDTLALALEGGEDYELVFAVRPGDVDRMLAASREAGLGIAGIGRVVSRANGVVLRREDGSEEELPPAGWDHFLPRT